MRLQAAATAAPPAWVVRWKYGLQQRQTVRPPVNWALGCLEGHCRRCVESVFFFFFEANLNNHAVIDCSLPSSRFFSILFCSTHPYKPSGGSHCCCLCCCFCFCFIHSMSSCFLTQEAASLEHPSLTVTAVM